MAKTIWKAVIQPNSERGKPYLIGVEARWGARAISVGKQGDNVCVWFEVDPDAPKDTMLLYCIGTGFGIVPTNCRFLGTVIDGPYVWHFYAHI